MNLNALLKDIDHKKNKDFNPNVLNLTCDSNEVKKDFVFACLKGTNFDGHDFAEKAISLGACAVLVEKDLKLENQILVEDSHKAYAKMCANFYDNPAEKLKIIGVTGTNGKTSVTKLIKNILTKQGKKVGLIGTIQNEIEEKILKTEKTTPSPLEFQQLLYLMLYNGCEYVVMEVSSHALVQQRIADTIFQVAVFTNLTQDHLDYHKTMEDYYNAKKMLFKRCKRAVICVDDEYGQKLTKEITCQFTSFAIYNQKANFLAKDVVLTAENVKYVLQSSALKEEVCFCTPGIFSVYNTMAAFISCLLIGQNSKDIVKSINSCPPISGRCEKIDVNTNYTVICDYAHTPDGLKNILSSINIYKKARLIALFGCGGDRDKNKRPKMGEIAAKNADFLIITSDNPRTEKPEKIIDDILIGVKKTSTPYVKIPDRKQAIYYALKNAKKDDIILLAGKGHEKYQVVGTKKIEMDEIEIVKAAVKELELQKNLKKY